MVRIHCQTHKQDPIARIDRDVEGFMNVYIGTPPPTYTVEPEPPKRRKLRLLEGSMPLEGPWVEGHWQGTDVIETWCPRCNGPHPLPLEWLQSVMGSERDLHCPCPVLRSPA